MPQRATLSINRDVDVNGNYHVVVSGEGFLPAPGSAHVTVRVRGSDEFFDDDLFTFSEPHLPGGNGTGIINPDGTFTIGKSVPGEALNEDLGEDEIYALVRVTGQFPRTQFGEVRTNRIKGRF